MPKFYSIIIQVKILPICKYFLTLCICLNTTCSLFGQNFNENLKWKKINTDNGLSHRVVNTICQDDYGYIWIGTNDGLNKLNGDRVINFYNSKENLQSNFISNLQKISNNKIFVSTNSGCIIMNCSTNKFEKIIDTTNELINEFFPSCLELNNKIWIFGNKGIYKVIQNKVISFKKYTIPKNYFITKGGTIKRYFETIYLNGFAYANMGRVLLKLDTAKMLPIEGIIIGNKNHEGIKEIVVRNNEIWMPTWGNGVVCYNTINKQQQYFGVGNDITFSLCNLPNSNDFLAATQNGFAIVNSQNSQVKNVSINNEVCRVFIDKKNTIWLCTASGIYYNDESYRLINSIKLNELAKNQLSDDKRLVNYISETKDYYFLGIEYANGLLILDKNFNYKKYIATLNKANNNNAFKDIKYVLQDEDNYWITTNAGLFLSNKNFEALKLFEPKNDEYSFGKPLQLRKIFKLNNEELLIQATTGVIVFNKKLQQFTRIFAALKNGKFKCLNTFCTDLCQGKNNKIYASTEDGILQINLNNGEIESLKIQSQNNRFNSIIYYNNKLYIANDAGFICYDIATKQCETFSREDGLSSSLINTLLLDETRNGIWIATANGINFFDFKTQNFSILNSFDGLPDNNIEGCFFLNKNNNLIVGNINTISEINPQLLKNKIENKAIKINSVLVNDSFIDFNENNYSINIPSEKNEIVFNLGMPALYLNNDAKYFYNIDSKWFCAEGNTVKLSNLQNGKHQIYFSNASNFNDATQKIMLTINTPFYKKWWFALICFAIFSSILFIIYKYRVRKIEERLKQKNDIDKQIQSLKETAFRAQMNPHFMFNTLNAINAFIIENKTDLASDYLIMFSKLMRNILENSKQPFISLDKELASLKLYLELESARLEQGFDYEIIVDKNIVTSDTNLPPLILQPFVENAIWHGLRNKKNDGKVWINIHQNQNNIVIEICDNGIGFSAANKLKQNQSNHKSYGIEITKERIELLNKKNTINIADRIMSNIICGTIVTIKLNT